MMNLTRTRITILTLVISALPGLVSAQESEGAALEKNVLELFLGGTYTDGEGTEFSLGLAYVRRLSERVGLGGLVEHTDGREWVIAAPIFFHATESWKIFLAPGVEHEDGENEFLVRLGNTYEFDMGTWTLAPELSFDFVDGDVKTVFGLNFGKDF